MHRRYSFIFKACALTLFASSRLQASPEQTLDTIKNMAGCFVVDYSFSETKVLDANYQLDPRVYDVKGFVVKELVKVVHESDQQIRLQHFMQADSHAGKTKFMMRHHGEIWQKNPAYRYKYLGRFGDSDRWDVETIDADDRWVRAVTNLDDGLRYQCQGTWAPNLAFSKFACKAFAPIPGRETRDMGRKDYNTLDRTTEVVIYNDSWLERQRNTKIQFSPDQQQALVEEVGKIWSVRVPEEECHNVSQWADERQPFWDVLAEAWDEAYDGIRPFHEIKLVDGTTRSAKIDAVMKRSFGQNLSDPQKRQTLKEELLGIIEEHRL